MKLFKRKKKPRNTAPLDKQTERYNNIMSYINAFYIVFIALILMHLIEVALLLTLLEAF